MAHLFLAGERDDGKADAGLLEHAQHTLHLVDVAQSIRAAGNKHRVGPRLKVPVAHELAERPELHPQRDEEEAQEQPRHKLGHRSREQCRPEGLPCRPACAAQKNTVAGGAIFNING